MTAGEAYPGDNPHPVNGRAEGGHLRWDHVEGRWLADDEPSCLCDWCVEEALIVLDPSLPKPTEPLSMEWFE